jgi:alpha-amylase
MDGEGTGVRLCIGFTAHEPYRLREAVVPEESWLDSGALETCISPTQQDRFSRAVGECYLPAATILLDWLDGGFPLAIGLSGIFVEQLELWQPDALEVFSQVSAHPRADVLSTTYHHSIASLFDDPREYAEDIRRHLRLMQDRFHVDCRVLADTSGCTPPVVPLHAAAEAGYAAVSLPDTADLLAEASPYRAVPWGGLQILPRHCHLAEDIALRFGQRDWDQYPLTAGKYAEWLAAIGGGSVHLLLDLALFGKVYRRESGIMEFLRSLPEACTERGVEGITPLACARAGDRPPIPAADSVAASPETIPHVCLRSVQQHTAFMAVQRAGRLIGGTEIWRILLDADHFSRMAMKSGECGSVRRSLSQQQVYEAFASYMRVLAAAEAAAAAKRADADCARILCCLPPERAFHFSATGRPAGFSAYSLEEFADMIRFAADDVIAFHSGRNDFARWIANCLNDPTLAREVEVCTGRNELLIVLDARIRALATGLKSRSSAGNRSTR